MIRISIHKKLNMADGTGALSIDTTIKKGELVAIFGKSGVGKTSLLRIIAGLMKPETGLILSDDEIWLNTEKKIDLPVQKRKTGFVFQDLALFPHMTIRENLQYAIKRKQDGKTIDHLLKMVNLECLANRKPDTLSGGQQQRVAIIRALAAGPQLLLLDEPFSSLDMEMRRHLREELLMLHRKFHLTTLLVTHEISDVYHLADKVMVIERGSITKYGRPEEVFDSGRADGRVELHGEVIGIRESGVVYIVEILTGNTITKLVVGEEERINLKPGMKVLICSGSFDPVIKVLSY